MAVTTSIFAIALILLVANYASDFRNRANLNTSSVGGLTRSCKSVTKTNTILLLLINVCATLVLGMSNTYQQLVTSLKTSDLKHVLSKFGDSRVGTNSPFNISHKLSGKKKAWGAWTLLVLTSMPVHFLANSLIGPSYVQELPSNIEFHGIANSTDTYYRPSSSYDELLEDDMSFPCWSAFRSGTPHLAESTAVFNTSGKIYGASQYRFGVTWKTMRVHYSFPNCTQFAQQVTDMKELESSFHWHRDLYRNVYAVDKCYMGMNVICTLHVWVRFSMRPLHMTDLQLGS